MNNNRDDLEERYNQFSDEEIIRLLSSGDLTELAQSVASNELKLRRLAIPSEVKGDIESIAIENLEANMRVVAEHLTISEANILCGLIQTEGIPAHVGDTNFSNLNSPFPSPFGNAYVRVPFEYVKQAMDSINAYNQGKYEFDASLDGDDTGNLESTVESEMVDKLTPDEMEIEALFKTLYPNPTSPEKIEIETLVKRLNLNTASSTEPSYKTTENHWFGLLVILAFLILMLITYQKITGNQFFETGLAELISKIKALDQTDFLLLIISPFSYFIINYSFSVLQKGEFKAKNGNTYTKADRPIAFWFEVIGGVIGGACLLVYGIWLLYKLLTA